MTACALKGFSGVCNGDFLLSLQRTQNQQCLSALAALQFITELLLCLETSCSDSLTVEDSFLYAVLFNLVIDWLRRALGGLEFAAVIGNELLCACKTVAFVTDVS